MGSNLTSVNNDSVTCLKELGNVPGNINNLYFDAIFPASTCMYYSLPFVIIPCQLIQNLGKFSVIFQDYVWRVEGCFDDTQ